MWSLLVILGLLGAAIADIQYYDTYTATLISEEEYAARVEDGTAKYCAIAVEDCVSDEGRRIDGSCNNLNYPSKGAPNTLNRRLLPANFGANFTNRLAKSGNDLPLGRVVRTNLLSEGKVPSIHWTHMATNFWLFMALDTTVSPDTSNYVLIKTYCCKPEGKNDSMCAPNPIPSDDPVHRFSEVRCMNMTRPATYQNQGCADASTGSERLNPATAAIDLSTCYGTDPNKISALRLNESGLLMYEVDDAGILWPPAIKENPEATCVINVAPDEVRCNDVPITVTNTVLGVNLMVIWNWRHHNQIARKLAAVNPSWSDEQLFMTTRDINIALNIQMYYYELLPIVMGRENLINDNVISDDDGFRDIYDSSYTPRVSHEYLYALRWVHTIQEGTLKMYDTDGSYLKQIPYGNLTLRTGYLAIDNNLVYITQGAFRQSAGYLDHSVDYEVAEVGLGTLQRALDLTLNDNMKSRFIGLPPYIYYLEYCAGSKITSFSDLAEHMHPEHILALKNTFESVEDIDLMAGIWLEDFIEGGFMPKTAYCLISEHLAYNVVSDRHWYESSDRPKAFTAKQLAEIRKASMARFLCDVGDNVTEIQPEAFRVIGPGNELTSCDNIPSIDYSVWADTSSDS